MNGNAQLRFLLNADSHRLAVLSEVGALGGHVKRIQELFQRVSLPSSAQSPGESGGNSRRADAR
jgi:hypothetical protein